MSQVFKKTQQVKDQQSYIFIFVAYLTFQVPAWSTRQDMTTVFQARPQGAFIEMHSNLKRKILHRTNQGFHFLGGNFSNKDNV